MTPAPPDDTWSGARAERLSVKVGHEKNGYRACHRFPQDLILARLSTEYQLQLPQ
jgi:hypothetical protein